MSRHRRQFFVERALIKGGKATISGSHARHIVRVLRLGPGDTINLVSDDGVIYKAVIKSATPASIDCTLVSKENAAIAIDTHVTLAQAIPRGRAMDYIIQKATELGVSTIVPIKAERSSIRLEGEKAEQKVERWQRIALEAAKQCSRYNVPQITAMKPLLKFLSHDAGAGAKIMLWEEEESLGLKEAMAKVKWAKRVNLIVGPEGGFTLREVEAAREYGYITVFLGQRILRTETASLVLLSILMYELEELGP